MNTDLFRPDPHSELDILPSYQLLKKNSLQAPNHFGWRCTPQSAGEVNIQIINVKALFACHSTFARKKTFHGYATDTEKRSCAKTLRSRLMECLVTVRQRIIYYVALSWRTCLRSESFVSAWSSSPSARPASPSVAPVTVTASHSHVIVIQRHALPQ